MCARRCHEPKGLPPHAWNRRAKDAAARATASAANAGRKRSGLVALFFSRSAATAAARARHGSETADA